MSAVYKGVLLPWIFLLKFVLAVCVYADERSKFFPKANNEKYQEVNRLASTSSSRDQWKAAEKLIERKIGHRAKDFIVIIESNLGPTDRNTFKVDTRTLEKVIIKGNNAISVVWGFQYYLTQYVDSHFSWDGDWLVVPKVWPTVPGGEITITSNDKFRYMANMCSFSYSYQWYNWQDWEKHIDWMALKGVNLPLASTGQEEIWRRVFVKFGLMDEEILGHFTGPGFLAWNRMGNIRTWGGPPSLRFLAEQLELQKKILSRMRSLSMIPIVPSFSGFVPEAMSRLYPRVKLHRLPSWNKFNGTYSRNLLLDSKEPLFEKISVAFIEEYKNEFATDHVYSADVFNEMPIFDDPESISSYGRAVYNGMLKADPRAIWVMQGWIFQDILFWTRERAKALLTSVPLGKMLVLDLFAEEQPRHRVYDDFFGQPFIWCMLHNFGGRSDLYGAIDSVNEGPLVARREAGGSMVGIGLSMEAIDQNYVVYEFMMEHAWLDRERRVDDWIESYVKRRYGTSNVNLIKAWQRLAHSAYNFTVGNRMRGPSFTNRPNLHMRPSYWYDPNELFLAWDGFVEYGLSSGTKNDLFRHDVVDVSRECADIILMKLQDLMASAHRNDDKTSYLYFSYIWDFIIVFPVYFSKHSNHWLSWLALQYVRRSIFTLFRFFNGTLMAVMSDLDSLLGTDGKFLLGAWIASARNSTPEAAEKDLFEFNARNQITLWGPDGNVLDYAAKQWSGLVNGYYLKRWRLFSEVLFTNWKHFKQDSFNEQVMEKVELPFSLDRHTFPSKPMGDPVNASAAFYHKYRGLAKILS